MIKADLLALSERDRIAVILDTMAQVVGEAGPDFRYTPPTGQGGACVYVTDGRPDCLIGCVMARLGWSLDELRRGDGFRRMDDSEYPSMEDDSEYPSMETVDASDLFGEDIGTGAASVLFAAQSVQDKGNLWTDALAAARDRAVAITAVYHPLTAR